MRRMRWRKRRRRKRRRSRRRKKRRRCKRKTEGEERGLGGGRRRRRREDKQQPPSLLILQLPACVTPLNINTPLISARHEDEDDDDDEEPRAECSPSRENLCVWRTKQPKRIGGPCRSDRGYLQGSRPLTLTMTPPAAGVAGSTGRLMAGRDRESCFRNSTPGKLQNK